MADMSVTDDRSTSVGFPPEEYEARRHAVRELMRERELEALVVTSPENVYYLLGLNHKGFFSFTLLVLSLEDPPVLVARAMEQPTIEVQVPDCRHVGFTDDEDPAAAAARAIGETVVAGGRVGVDQENMFLPFGVWSRVQQALTRLQFADGSGIVEELRAVKSPAEIVHVRRAAAISDIAIQAGIARAAVGVNERDIAAAIYHAMISAGSEYPGSVPNIRTQENLGQEHVTWQGRTLQRGDVLFMELSASVGRYHAPLTRMVDIGPPAAGRKVAAAIALAGLAETRRVLRPGAVTGDVYAAWKRAVDEGFGHHDHHRHHCGYQVGIGFPPSWVGGGSVLGIRENGAVVVKAGMVFHLFSWIAGRPPGDYIVSETVLVDHDGCEVLTTTSREPLTVL